MDTICDKTMVKNDVAIGDMPYNTGPQTMFCSLSFHLILDATLNSMESIILAWTFHELGVDLKVWDGFYRMSTSLVHVAIVEHGSPKASKYQSRRKR